MKLFFSPKNCSRLTAGYHKFIIGGEERGGGGGGEAGWGHGGERDFENQFLQFLYTQPIPHSSGEGREGGRLGRDKNGFRVMK